MLRMLHTEASRHELTIPFRHDVFYPGSRNGGHENLVEIVQPLVDWWLPVIFELFSRAAKGKPFKMVPFEFMNYLLV